MHNDANSNQLRSVQDANASFAVQDKHVTINKVNKCVYVVFRDPVVLTTTIEKLSVLLYIYCYL